MAGSDLAPLLLVVGNRAICRGIGFLFLAVDFFLICLYNPGDVEKRFLFKYRLYICMLLFLLGENNIW